jgi:hypothetical protein
VNLDELIEAIVIAPQAERWFSELVAAMTGRYGVGVTPSYSPLAEEPFWR